jgi:hypothetical protein
VFPESLDLRQRRSGPARGDVEIRTEVLRALTLVDRPGHPFWGTGYAGSAAVEKLAHTLYAWLTGINDEPGVHDKSWYRAPVESVGLRVVVPEAPADLAEVVHAGMRATRESRFRSLEDFCAALTASLGKI